MEPNTAETVIQESKGHVNNTCEAEFNSAGCEKCRIFYVAHISSKDTIVAQSDF